MTDVTDLEEYKKKQKAKKKRKTTGVFAKNKKGKPAGRVINKLTDEQWAEVREAWQKDVREGLEWVAKLFKIGAMTVSRRKKAEGWTKNPGVESINGHADRHKQAKELSRKIGRPSDYKPEYDELMVNWFKEQSESYREIVDPNNESRVNIVPNRPPSMPRFATMIGVCKNTLLNWAYETDADGNLVRPSFFRSYQIAMSYQEAAYLEGAMVGAYSSTISQLMLRNHHFYKTDATPPSEGKGGRADTDELDRLYEQARIETAERQKAIEGRFERLIGGSEQAIQDGEFSDSDD